jgi:hypothetical protein
MAMTRTCSKDGRKYFIYFTATEAEEKNRSWVRICREILEVPAGTLGLVTGIYESGIGAFGLEITWQRKRKPPRTTRFSKDEYCEDLEEIRVA